MVVGKFRVPKLAADTSRCRASVLAKSRWGGLVVSSLRRCLKMLGDCIADRKVVVCQLLTFSIRKHRIIRSHWELGIGNWAWGMGQEYFCGIQTVCFTTTYCPQIALEISKRDTTGGRKKKKHFLERFLTIDIYAILTLSIIPQKI